MIILLLVANLSNTDLAHDNRGWADVATSPTFFGFLGVEQIACEPNPRLDLFDPNIFHFPRVPRLFIQVQHSAFWSRYLQLVVHVFFS